MIPTVVERCAGIDVGKKGGRFLLCPIPRSSAEPGFRPAIADIKMRSGSLRWIAGSRKFSSHCSLDPGMTRLFVPGGFASCAAAPDKQATIKTMRVSSPIRMVEKTVARRCTYVQKAGRRI
jgi:hypothetical protein